MGEYERLVEQLRDQGMEDMADEFEKFSATSLRKKAAAYDDVLKERDKLRSEVEELVDRPRREAAFREAGVDYDSLRPAEKRLLSELRPDGDISEEWVAGVISDYGLPTLQSVEPRGEGPSAAKMTEAATNAPQGKSTGHTITPAVAAEWSVDKMVKFAENYPEAWDQLKRGETVTGIQA